LLGLTVDPSTPEELAEMLEQQRAQFGKVIEVLELKPAK
jgi:hypothetical protein